MPKPLRDAIAKSGAVGFDAEVLRYLVLEPLGIREEAFASVMASRTRETGERCTQALARLLGRGLVRSIPDGGHRRYVANQDELALDAAALESIAAMERPPAVTQLGPPHAEPAMRSLAKTLLEQRGHLYIGLDITAHDVFTELEERARRGFRTTFLAPHRSAVPSDLREHWDHIYSGWATWLRASDRGVRKNVTLLITPKYYRHLSTSLAAEDHVRLDVYWKQDDTTRKGEIIRAESGTSLYDFVRSEYEDALVTAYPYWRVSLIDFLVVKVRRLVIPVFVVLALVAINYWGLQQVTLGQRLVYPVVSSLLSDIIGGLFLKRLWWHPKKPLF